MLVVTAKFLSVLLREMDVIPSTVGVFAEVFNLLL